MIRRLTEAPRTGDVPPVRRLLRRVVADVLPRRRVPDAATPTSCSATWTSGSTATYRSGCRRSQFEYWKHTHLTIDVVPGRGAGFSLEAPEGVRFLIRSRLMTDQEYADDQR